jgi:hypothetical protein
MTSEELLTHAALKSWTQILARFDKELTHFSDDDFQKRVAPGRNRLYYLLGHLTAVHDRLFPLLDLGEPLYPELDEPFITHPDGAVGDPVPVAELRQAWTTVNKKLTGALGRLTPQEWLRKHAAVSNEEFSADPSRNRLAVVLSRSNHLSFHTGQIILAK